MSTTNTRAEVFIVESMQAEDEREDSLEGRRIADMLKLSGKTCQYYHPRNQREFKAILPVFQASGYRYLHISCHGNKKGLYPAFGHIDSADVGKMLKPYIHNRRVFISSCYATRMPLAQALLVDTGCYSVMGPYTSININDAALFWAAFYHLMFKRAEDMMKKAVIKEVGRKVARLYGARIGFYTINNGTVNPRSCDNSRSLNRHELEVRV